MVKVKPKMVKVQSKLSVSDKLYHQNINYIARPNCFFIIDLLIIRCVNNDIDYCNNVKQPKEIIKMITCIIMLSVCIALLLCSLEVHVQALVTSVVTQSGTTGHVLTVGQEF